MDSKSYRDLLDGVFSLIDSRELEEALSHSRASERVDSVQDLIREAIKSSTIGRFKGVPYFFNGKIYEEMHPDEFGNLIYDLMKKCDLPKGDYSRVEGVIRVCRRVIAGKELTPDRSIMVFKNCVLDTKNRTTHGFHPRFVQMTMSDYRYEKEGFNVQWKGFLDSVLPDIEEQRILQEALGCLLINRSEAKLEHITFLYGTGANGKSVVFETVLGVFGKENISNYPLMSLISGGDRKMNIASMDGLWANYCSESQQVNINKHEDAFKSLTSGEPTEARQIFGQNFMARNIPLQFVNVNKMPEVSNLSNSLKRRIVIVDFKIEIPVERQNKQLSRIFKKEYSGILNWIMDGRDKFVRNKYEFTDRNLLDEKLEEYQAEANTVSKFMLLSKFYRINKNITDTDPKWVESSVLYDKYEKWCLENEVPAESMVRFGAILRDNGYMKKRTAKGNAYAIFGPYVMSSLNYRHMTERATSKERDKRRPYYSEGVKYIDSVSGLSKQVHVSAWVLRNHLKSGLLEGCYEVLKGGTVAFDIAAIKARLKELGLLMSDYEKAKIDRKRVVSASKRALFNQTMKTHNSKRRVYKPKVDERYEKVMEKVLKDKS